MNTQLKEIAKVWPDVASHELPSSHFMFSETHTSVPHFFIQKK